MKDGASCAAEMERVTRWSGTTSSAERTATKSEKYGLVVYLCGEKCHRNGRAGSTPQRESNAPPAPIRPVKAPCRNRDGRRMTSAVNLEKAICKEENDGKQNDFAGAALL